MVGAATAKRRFGIGGTDVGHSVMANATDRERRRAAPVGEIREIRAGTNGT